MNIISTRVYNQNQSWFFERTVSISNHKLKAEIRRNAYDDQSYAKVDRWDGTKWHNVISKPITECHCKKISYVDSNISESNFSYDWANLIIEAKQIIL